MSLSRCVDTTLQSCIKVVFWGEVVVVVVLLGFF